MVRERPASRGSRASTESGRFRTGSRFSDPELATRSRHSSLVSRRVQGSDAAAKALFAIVKQYPGVTMALAIKPGGGEREVLEALSEQLDPVQAIDDILRDCGCKDGRRAQAVVLTPLALRVLESPAKTCWTKQKRVTCIAILVFLELVLLSVSVAFTVLLSQWQSGTCALADFWAGKCMQMKGQNTACDFEVQILYQVDGGSKVARIRWTPPSTYDYVLGRYVWGDSPLSCCEDRHRAQRLSCCSMADITGYMCDNWPDRTDTHGRPCHSGPWQCRFKLGMTNGTEEVQEMEVDSGSPLLWLYLSAGFVLVLLVGLQAYWEFWKRHDMEEVLELPPATPPTLPTPWEEDEDRPPEMVGWDVPEQPKLSLGNFSRSASAANDQIALPGVVPGPSKPEEAPPVVTIEDAEANSAVNAQMKQIKAGEDVSEDDRRDVIKAQLRTYSKLANESAFMAQLQPLAPSKTVRQSQRRLEAYGGASPVQAPGGRHGEHPGGSGERRQSSRNARTLSGP